MERVDCVVIGAGVIGLAIARRLAMAGHEVIVLEADCGVGTQTSARNSEVIHAGIYYPTNSLKAKLCLAGREALYSYCAERGIPHNRIGKLLVATDQRQLARLAEIGILARRNGVHDLVSLGAGDVRAMEPAIICEAALYSPSTGIIDTHTLMLSLQADAEAAGASVVLNTPVMHGALSRDGFHIHTGGDAPISLHTRILINSAGLDAQTVACNLSGYPANKVPPIYYAKGSYFGLSGGRAPFSRLIYPMPDEAGLGTHVTLDLAGRARFGPDVEWVVERNYQVDPVRAENFYTDIRRYWPGLPDNALQPDYCGIRPKVSGPGQAASDFVIHGPPQHHIAGLVHLFGMESPGITASLAIAEHVYQALQQG